MEWKNWLFQKVVAKSSNIVLFGIDLEPDNYVYTAISIVRILKMEPEDSDASLAKSVLDTMSDVFYKVETLTPWLVFLTSLLIFLELPKRNLKNPKIFLVSRKIVIKYKLNCILKK